MPDQTLRPDQAWREALEFGARLAHSAEALGRVRDEDVDVGATPKTEVMRVEKVTLSRYTPLEGVEVKTGPVLIVYGLVGRYTMADLQEDRSLVRNLLGRGVDLYVVEWGNPTRADQFLSMTDYIDWFLDDCVDRIHQEVGVDKVTLLGICEGGTFSTLYAARHVEKVQNLILTITPIDFHADMDDPDVTHGFLNVWTRNLENRDIERLIEAFGNLPGEIMASVFQMLTPVRNLTKYNIDLFDIAGDEEKLMNFLRMEKMACRPAAPSGSRGTAVADRSLQGKPAGQRHVRARRRGGRPPASHHADPQRLRAAGPHHPAALRVSARPRDRLRGRCLAGRPRGPGAQVRR